MEPKVFSNILDIASSEEKIVDLSCFCEKVHELAGCQKPYRNIQVFACTLDNYLKDTTKTVKEWEDFFYSHCSNLEPAFKSMFALSTNKSYTISL